MPRGKTNLQEMETGTKQSRTVVNAGAKPAEPMPHLTTGIPDGQRASGWEDLGGPTPDNYRSTDDSAKLKDPAAILSQVRNVVNRGAKAADAMKKMKEELDAQYEDEYEDEVIGLEDDDARPPSPVARARGLKRPAAAAAIDSPETADPQSSAARQSAKAPAPAPMHKRRNVVNDSDDDDD